MASPHTIRRRMAATTPVLLAALLIAFTLAATQIGDRAIARMAAETLIRVTLVVGFWVFVGNSGVVSFGHAAFVGIGAYVSAWLTLTPAMKATLLPGLPAMLAAAHWPVFPAAAASGIDRYRHRLLAYVVSAFLCGAGGALMGHFIGVINPDGFYLSLTFLMLAMRVVGVLVLSVAVEALVRLEKGFTLGATTFALPPGSQEIILAVAMILILIFRPAGLMAGREVMLPARWVTRRNSP